MGSIEAKIEKNYKVISKGVLKEYINELDATGEKMYLDHVLTAIRTAFVQGEIDIEWIINRLDKCTEALKEDKDPGGDYCTDRTKVSRTSFWMYQLGAIQNDTVISEGLEELDKDEVSSLVESINLQSDYDINGISLQHKGQVIVIRWKDSSKASVYFKNSCVGIRRADGKVGWRPDLERQAKTYCMLALTKEGLSNDWE